jgi:hypothetical protein
MNSRLEDLMYRAGLTAQGCWDSMDDYDHRAIEKFAELIIRECMDLLEDYTTDVHVGGIQYNVLSAEETLQKHFGVERD